MSDTIPGPAPAPPRCTCGTVIPCDAHETDDDRREAMRKIREGMLERVRAFAEGKVTP